MPAQPAPAELAQAQRHLDLLRHARRHIGTSLDVFRTAQELADATVPAIADGTAVDILDSVVYGEAPVPGPVVDRIAVRRAGGTWRGGRHIQGLYAMGDVRLLNSGTPYAHALADLRPRLVRRLRADDPWLLRSGRGAVIRQAGFHSMMVVPMAARDVVLGLAAFYRGEGSPAFTEADLEMAADAVGHASLCVDNARRYTREHTLVRLVQHSLVPSRLPASEALETAYSYLPVSADGTWYDVLPLSGARVALVVGQVAGTGLRAVTTMGRLRAAISALAAMDLAPGELMTQLHELTMRLGEEAHTLAPGESSDAQRPTATCLFAVWDPVTGHCEAVSAGHPAPALRRPGASPATFGVEIGPPLGQGLPDYPLARTALPGGSLLALRNNGLPDRMSEALRTLPDNGDTTLQEDCEALVSRLLPAEPRTDAVLLLARTRLLPPGRVSSWTLTHGTHAPARARSLVTGRLDEWGLDGLAFATELIVSELVTNAVRYSSDSIELRLILLEHSPGTPETLICEVTDTSNTTPQLRHAEDDDEGGRGLYLVAQLAQRWGMRPADPGKTIWAEQDIPG